MRPSLNLPNARSFNPLNSHFENYFVVVVVGVVVVVVIVVIVVCVDVVLRHQSRLRVLGRTVDWE
jgi:penicillin V acylase-like amidase (Ntn superfamily)